MKSNETCFGFGVLKIPDISKQHVKMLPEVLASLVNHSELCKLFNQKLKWRVQYFMELSLYNVLYLKLERRVTSLSHFHETWSCSF